MAIKKYKPVTPGMRHRVGNTYSEVTTRTPEKSLLVSLRNSGGRNNQGRMTIMRIISSGDSVDGAFKQLDEIINHYSNQLNSQYKIDFNGRVAGDDPYDITDTNYGNAFVIGSKDGEMHGTHVAGIVAAERNNGVGMNGVAHNVKIMSIRAVPDGDEYDKDVALAIRYAADNGAKVVNMSFGKSYSPNAQWVYDAIKYAEEKDVNPSWSWSLQINLRLEQLIY